MVKSKSIKPKEKRIVISNKKQNRDRIIKKMDMLKFKQRISEIMAKISNDKTMIKNDIIKNKKNIEVTDKKYVEGKSSLYQDMFQKYIKNEFSLNCISYINKIILDIKKNYHLQQYEGKYNFNKLLITLTKELLLNEFELILLSLYFEYIDLSLNFFTMEESFLYVCFFIKKLTINENQLTQINSFLSNKYQNFNINYDKWYKINEEKISKKLYFTYFEINQKIRDYNNPFNAYCKNNYIDYNYIVDKILTMSLPYIDLKKERDILVKNSDSIFLTIKDQNKKNNLQNLINDDININYINNNYIKNNYINNIVKNTNIDININDINEFYNKQIFEPEQIKNVNLNNNFIGENINNNEFILNNNEPIVTPNNLLHDLSNINKYMFENNKILNQNLIENINNKNAIEYPLNNYKDINNVNLINISRQEEDFLPKKNESDLIMNQLQNISQSSFIFQQKPSLMEINLPNKINSSHIFDDEGETLKQILRNNDNYFRSSMNFDFPKSSFNIFNNRNNNNIIDNSNSNDLINRRKNNNNLNSNKDTNN